MRKLYDPAVELQRGADLSGVSYDKTQRLHVLADKVTVGGDTGTVRISGTATGKHDDSIDGTANLWLSIFRYMRPDRTINHVSGWSIYLSLKEGQTAEETAKAFTEQINASSRPYRAAIVPGSRSRFRILYVEN